MRWPNACWAVGRRPLTRRPSGTPPQPLAARHSSRPVPRRRPSPSSALARATPGAPDTAAIKVMNAALGGLFTSRINQQLREVRGYTLRHLPGFQMGRERGSFGLYGSVRSDVVGAALKDIDRGWWPSARRRWARPS